MLGSVLVACRGRALVASPGPSDGWGSVSIAVYSDADARARHVREADHAEPIGEGPAPLSYLNPAAIADAALRPGAEAVHPGYGFLSEIPGPCRGRARRGSVRRLRSWS